MLTTCQVVYSATVTALFIPNCLRIQWIITLFTKSSHWLLSIATSMQFTLSHTMIQFSVIFPILTEYQSCDEATKSETQKACGTDGKKRNS